MNITSLRYWFRSLFLPSDRQFYLAAFRVLAGIVILCKIMILWPSRKFLFGSHALFEYPDDSMVSFGFIPHSLVWDHPSLFYVILSTAAVLMVFGIGRRWTVAAVYVGTRVHQDVNWLLCDGGDNLLQFSLLYLALADSFSHLSLSKTGPARQEYTFNNFFTNVAVAALIGHLCLVYLISGLSKAHAEVWYNGTAMYYILNGERFRGTGWYNEFLGNSVLFNFVVCYTTIIWETTFAFAVFVRRLRVPVLLMGVGMHLSIFVLMMIQSFQLIYVLHYGFFFTDDEWARFLTAVRARLRFQSASSENSSASPTAEMAGDPVSWERAGHA